MSTCRSPTPRHRLSTSIFYGDRWVGLGRGWVGLGSCWVGRGRGWVGLGRGWAVIMAVKYIGFKRDSDKILLELIKDTIK